VGLWELSFGLSLPDDLDDELGPFPIAPPMQLMVQQHQQALPNLVPLRVIRFGCRLQVGLLGVQIERVLDNHVQPIEYLPVGHHRNNVVRWASESYARPTAEIFDSRS
jgi:hypothetical protein